jgi:hypothetical protein
LRKQPEPVFQGASRHASGSLSRHRAALRKLIEDAYREAV